MPATPNTNNAAPSEEEDKKGATGSGAKGQEPQGTNPVAEAMAILAAMTQNAGRNPLQFTDPVVRQTLLANEAINRGPFGGAKKAESRRINERRRAMRVNQGPSRQQAARSRKNLEDYVARLPEMREEARKKRLFQEAMAEADRITRETQADQEEVRRLAEERQRITAEREAQREVDAGRYETITTDRTPSAVETTSQTTTPPPPPPAAEDSPIAQLPSALVTPQAPYQGPLGSGTPSALRGGYPYDDMVLPPEAGPYYRDLPPQPPYDGPLAVDLMDYNPGGPYSWEVPPTPPWYGTGMTEGEYYNQGDFATAEFLADRMPYMSPTYGQDLARRMGPYNIPMANPSPEDYFNYDSQYYTQIQNRTPEQERQLQIDLANAQAMARINAREREEVAAALRAQSDALTARALTPRERGVRESIPGDSLYNPITAFNVGRGMSPEQAAYEAMQRGYTPPVQPPPLLEAPPAPIPYTDRRSSNYFYGSVPYDGNPLGNFPSMTVGGQSQFGLYGPPYR